MKTDTPTPGPRRRGAMMGALWAALILGSCTLIADRDADQCATDGDCAHLSGDSASYICSSERVCVSEGTTELCAQCHGGGENPAPPTSISGETETSAMAVGAHQTHLLDSEVRDAMWCQECHLVPTTLDEPAHQDGLPAEVSFGVLASTRGASPSWDRDAAKCNDVYCHGSTLDGGANQAPTWTAASGSQAFCGSCHGVPPLAPHPARYECELCHPATINDDGGIDLAGGHHINGQVELGALDCNACHGSEANDAPPQATNGATDATDIRVGAHQAHVVGGSLASAIGCDACHVVPPAVNDPAHIDQAPAEVTFGGIATSDGANPSWDRNVATCSSTYCHGATLIGGAANPPPQWTDTSGSEATCGACHGLPPSPPHAAQTACYGCHAKTIDADSVIDPTFHINGTVDYN